MQQTDRWKTAVLIATSIAALAAVMLMHPIAQDSRYHLFADGRTYLGIPNFWNVVTNLPFLIVGVSGLWELRAGKLHGGLGAAIPIYRVFFWGISFVALGSAYYHWAPSNASLVWDRLPMTLAFMAFFCAVLAEYVSVSAGRRLLPVLLLAGLASVVSWYLGDRHGAGDLRWYALVQFLPMALLPLILLMYHARLKPASYLWAVLGAYALSKLAEFLDVPILHASSGLISGHSIKHLLAGLGTYAYLLALRQRKPVSGTAHSW